MASNINLSDTTDSSASSTVSSDSPTPTSPGPRKDDANDIEHTPSSAAELQSETCESALAEESAPAEESVPADESVPAEESAPVDSAPAASAAAKEQVSAESDQQVESAPVARKNHMQSNIVLGDDRPPEKKGISWADGMAVDKEPVNILLSRLWICLGFGLKEGWADGVGLSQGAAMVVYWSDSLYRAAISGTRRLIVSCWNLTSTGEGVIAWKIVDVRPSPRPPPCL